MKLGIILSLLVLFVLPARADRWVLKNPQQLTSAIDVISRMEFFGNEYVVVESDRHPTDQLTVTASTHLVIETLAEAAFADLNIGVSIVNNEPAQPAWHVERMRYKDIDPNLNGSGVVVAVLDTGVDGTHPQLKEHMWINQGEVAENEIDDDANGLIDDVFGYNFAEKNNNPADDGGHGTHCAGIIAADTQPEGEARGVAKGVTIMPLRIIGSNGQSFLSDAALAIQYAVDNGANVLSNSWRIYKSWSGYYNEEGVKFLGEALKYAESRNVIFVAAAGNETVDLSNKDGNPMFPGGMEGHRNLFVVGATDSADAFAYFSNFGKSVVHVASPGVSILSTVPGGWRSMSGTSMATPLVAGVLALGLQHGYTAEEAMVRLIESSEQTSWADKVISGGIINILGYLE